MSTRYEIREMIDPVLSWTMIVLDSRDEDGFLTYSLGGWNRRSVEWLQKYTAITTTPKKAQDLVNELAARMDVQLAIEPILQPLYKIGGV